MSSVAVMRPRRQPLLLLDVCRLLGGRGDVAVDVLVDVDLLRRERLGGCTRRRNVRGDGGVDRCGDVALRSDRTVDRCSEVGIGVRG